MERRVGASLIASIAGPATPWWTILALALTGSAVLCYSLYLGNRVEMKAREVELKALEKVDRRQVVELMRSIKEPRRPWWWRWPRRPHRDGR